MHCLSNLKMASESFVGGFSKGQVLGEQTWWGIDLTPFRQLLFGETVLLSNLFKTCGSITRRLNQKFQVIIRNNDQVFRHFKGDQALDAIHALVQQNH